MPLDVLKVITVQEMGQHQLNVQLELMGLPQVLDRENNVLFALLDLIVIVLPQEQQLLDHVMPCIIVLRVQQVAMPLFVLQVRIL